MKKLLKLHEGRTLTASVGKLGSYNHRQAIVTASQKDGVFTYQMVTISSAGRFGIPYDDADSLLLAMKEFNKLASAWKVSRKPKAIKPPKAKPAKKVVEVMPIKKGRA